MKMKENTDEWNEDKHIKREINCFSERSNKISSNADQKTKKENTNSNTRNLKRDNTLYI